MVCCSAGERAVLDKLQQIQFLILYKQDPTAEMLSYFLSAVDTVQSEFVVASNSDEKFLLWTQNE